MKVLMAVGEKNLSQILKAKLIDAGFDVAKEEVLHRDYLNEKVDFERPDLLIIHDQQLPSRFTTKEENEEELYRLIGNWRTIYDTQMRVVVMCERERKDPFLAQLVSRNVLDIFNERQIPTTVFIQQLLSPPKYVNVSRYGLSEADLSNLMDISEKKTDENEVELLQEDSKSSFLKMPKIPKVPRPHIPNISISFKPQIEAQKEIALLERKIILVVSPFERTGSTFIAHQLAFNLAKQKVGVKYFENPFKIPYTYDRLNGSNDAKDYYSPYSVIPDDDHNVYVRHWKKDGVEIQAMNPTTERQLEEEEFPISRFLRHLLSVHDCPYLIVDIGADNSKQTYDELVEIASHILVVVDSDLSKLELFEQYQMHEKFGWIHNLLQERKTHVIANRYVKGVESALPLDTFIPVPPFKDEWIFRAQVEGGFEFKDAQKEQKAGFKELLSHILNKKDLKKKNSPVNRIKNWLPSLDVEKEKDKMEEIT